ncbi:hypothetical protein ACFLTP_06660 [Chloroflexota bacterium]
MKNNYNRPAFKRDFEKLLKSIYAKDRLLLVDNRVVNLDFEIIQSKEVIFTSTDKCLELLKINPKSTICLTIGTSYWFPSIGDSQWEHYLRGQFQYPSLQGYNDIHIAEIHCYCCNWAHKGPAIEQYYRISVYEINGESETKTRLARFENGKEIDEGNLKLGEDLETEVLSITNFSGPGGYDAALNAEGRGIGGTVVKFGISQAMEKHGLSFPEACRFLEKKGNLIWVDNGGKVDK